jgi:hypothetical protein
VEVPQVSIAALVELRRFLETRRRPDRDASIAAETSHSQPEVAG